MQSLQCDCCQEMHRILFPVDNRDPFSPQEFDWVCRACADVLALEQVEELLRSPVTFESLVSGRVAIPVAA